VDEHVPQSGGRRESFGEVAVDDAEVGDGVERSPDVGRALPRLDRDDMGVDARSQVDQLGQRMSTGPAGLRWTTSTFASVIRWRSPISPR
jgi:hypothetical protein